MAKKPGKGKKKEDNSMMYQALAGVVIFIFGSLFIPKRDDNQPYTNAAARVADAANSVANALKNDGEPGRRAPAPPRKNKKKPKMFAVSQWDSSDSGDSSILFLIRSELTNHDAKMVRALLRKSWPIASGIRIFSLYAQTPNS
jgi:hypothetical protein